MQSALELFRQMTNSDIEYLSNCSQNSFTTFRTSLHQLGFNTSRTSDTFISISQQTQQIPVQRITQANLNRIDEWQKQQDAIAQQLLQQQLPTYVPIYPIKRQLDLKQRFEQHNHQIPSLNQTLENKLQRVSSYISPILESQIISEINDQSLLIKQENEIKKKSNLKSNTSKTVDKKKSVKINDKKKSQSEEKKSKSTKNDDKPPKPKKTTKETIKESTKENTTSKSPSKSPSKSSLKSPSKSPIKGKKKEESNIKSVQSFLKNKK